MVFVVGPTFAAALLSFAGDSLLKIRAFGPTVVWWALLLGGSSTAQQYTVQCYCISKWS